VLIVRDVFLGDAFNGIHTNISYRTDAHCRRHSQPADLAAEQLRLVVEPWEPAAEAGIERCANGRGRLGCRVRLGWPPSGCFKKFGGRREVGCPRSHLAASRRPLARPSLMRSLFETAIVGAERSLAFGKALSVELGQFSMKRSRDA
jgi:hypothetical protein